MKARIAFGDRSPVRIPWRSDDLASMDFRALEHDRRPPESYEGHMRFPDSDRLTAEEITRLWNPPRGYVPPVPSTEGLLQNPY